jgi:hypothetical protein
VLNDLQGDTFYVITVHGYNDEGDGDKLRIEVSTKDSPDSCKYCECFKTFIKTLFHQSFERNKLRELTQITIREVDTGVGGNRDGKGDPRLRAILHSFPFVSAPFCHFPARSVLVRETIKRRKIEGLLAV